MSARNTKVSPAKFIQVLNIKILVYSEEMVITAQVLVTSRLAARGLKGLKQAGFLDVLPSFSSHFFLLDSLYVHDTDILKRYWSWLTFSGRWEHFYKVPPLHKGHHRQLNK